MGHSTVRAAPALLLPARARCRLTMRRASAVADVLARSAVFDALSGEERRAVATWRDTRRRGNEAIIVTSRPAADAARRPSAL
jgi:hypothetical protein